jgi:hypothetical protein
MVLSTLSTFYALTFVPRAACCTGAKTRVAATLYPGAGGAGHLDHRRRRARAGLRVALRVMSPASENTAILLVTR